MKRFLLFCILYSVFCIPLRAQKFLWGQYGKGDGIAQGIFTDNKSNCYLSGLIPNDTIHFGSYTLMNSTITNPPYSSVFDAFLVKYNAKGNVIWAKQWYGLDTSNIHYRKFPLNAIVNGKSLRKFGPLG